MTRQQAHELKLKMAQFAEVTAMIQFYQGKGTESQLEVALAERDRVRNELYAMIDSLVTEE
jgi:hypothetical protein